MTKEKARPAVGAAGQADKKELLAGENLSQPNFTTPTEREQGPVEGLLGKGRENALSLKTLTKMAGFRTARDLRLQIAKERKAGSLILSSCRGHGGYYRPADGPEGRLELQEFVQSMASRGTCCFAAATAAKKALQKLDGQIAFDEVEG